MVFSSLTFLFLFFPIVIGVYYLCPRALRNLWLLAASLLFYAWGEPVYIRLMVASILFNYLCGLGVAALQKREKKGIAKALLILCVAGNIGALGVFKYADLLIGTINGIAGSHLALLELALPIGISFYTFQALSYVIDVYRGTVAAQKNPITFGTYIALFPQLIAGPIVQYKTVEEQLSCRRETAAQFAAGIGRFTVGLGKKVLIANQVGALWDTVSALPQAQLAAGTAWLGALAFTFQIYFDFSGYSDMAIGLGRMFGFHFLENFNYPYISASITEFWRRWHISLSNWFREYVYIPLGGNRHGLSRQILNLIIVWGLTGLWHGASWNFLLWGLYYGVILIVEKVWLLRPLQKAPAAVQHLYSLLLIILGWIIFALTDFSAIGGYFAALFGAHGGLDSSTMYLLTSNLILLVIAGFASTRLPAKLAAGFVQRLTPAGQTAVKCVFYTGVLLMCIAFLVGDSYNPFLYFRF